MIGVDVDRFTWENRLRRSVGWESIAVVFCIGSRGSEMAVVNFKAARQKLMQAAVLNKIGRENLALDTDLLRRSLQTVREHVSRSPYFTEMLALSIWALMLHTNPALPTEHLRLPFRARTYS